MPDSCSATPGAIACCASPAERRRARVVTTPPYDDLRRRLVRQLRERGAVRTERVGVAFAHVPRHVFVPGVPPEDVYADRSIAIKLLDGIPISSSSQPAIMAEMIEMLALRGGERVLEIGAGTGYNAAVLAELVGPSGSVVTVDVDDELVASARRHLDDAGYAHVRTLCADGVLGDAGTAPFDRIIATVGVEALPAAWIAQLREGGRLVAPLTIRGQQKVIAFARTARGLESDAIVDAGFIMLRGDAAHAETVALALDEPGTTLRVHTAYASSADVHALTRALRAKPRDTAPVRRIAIDDVWGGFALWLGLNDAGFCRLTAQGPGAEETAVPNLAVANGTPDGFASTIGIAGDGELAVFAPRGMNDVVVRRFGDDRGAVTRLQRAIAGWDDAARPGNGSLRVTVDVTGTTHVAFGTRRDPA
ncbi:MAG: protein-L-isoaspartate(D-aspartate) O-methyltransferase [Candidatus Eremiobacteraeota bacterium]|nr:protein-L-isoaspartate(D-aspartate) O-methyltransferase [Candidatus Eremiobacteraeota bacterium]